MEPAEAAEAITALSQRLAPITQAFHEMQASHEHLLQRMSAQERHTAEATALPPSPPFTPQRTLEVVTSEPTVGLPERFSGHRRKYRSFVISCELLFSLRPCTYSSNFIKVRTAISLLSGPPQTWAHQLLHTDDPVLSSWGSFVAAMQALYDDPLRSSTARGMLRTLRQGRRPVEDYITEFREVALDIGLNNVALIDQFRIGLADHLKDELARIGIPDTLEELMRSVNHVDRRFWERRQERQHALPPTRRSELLPLPVPVPTPAAGETVQEEPMQIGMVRGPLSAVEKERRWALRLCLY